MEWVLILTLYAAGYNKGGPAVTAVGGFESRSACLAAGNAWLAKQRAFRSFYLSDIDANALCVPATKDSAP